MVGVDDPVDLLVVTSDDDYAATVRQTLGAEFAVTVVATADAAFERLARGSVDCILSDTDLPDTDGLAFLQAVRVQDPSLPFVLVTDDAEAVASQALAANVTEYVTKAAAADRLREVADAVTTAVAYYRSRPRLHDVQTESRMLLDASPHIIGIVRDGHYEFLNQRALDRLSVADRDEFVGEPLATTLRDGESDLTPERVAAIQRGASRVERLETRLQTLDGQQFPVEVTAARVQWDGTPAVVLIGRDLTDQQAQERKRAAVDAALRTEGTLADRIFEDSPIPKVIVDEAGTVVRTNDRAAALFGASQADLAGRSYAGGDWEFVDDDGVVMDSADLPYADALERGESAYGAEHGLVRPDGEMRWLSVSVSPLVDETAEDRYSLVVLSDVTEKKRLRDELRASEHLHRVTLNNITDTVLITDDEGVFTYVCPNVDFIFGYSQSAVVEMGTVDELLGDDPAPAEFETGDVRDNVEMTVTDATGDAHTVLVTIRSVDVQGGTRLYSVRDVTERRREETRFRTFVENFTDVMTILDDEGRIQYVTPSIERALGYDQTEIVGSNAFDLVHPDDREAVLESFEALSEAENGARVEVEYRNRRADGSWTWTSSNAAKQTDLADGNYMVISRDVTDRVTRERTLEQMEESRSFALQAADAGIWEWDMVTDEVVWHETTERLFGLEPGTFEGTYEAFARRLHPNDLPTAEAALDAAIRNDEQFKVRYRIQRDDGIERWVEARGKILTDGDDGHTRMLGVNVDVTEREEHMQQLRVLDTVLRHNFRNDMNVVRGFAELVAAESEDPVSGYAEKIVDQSDHLVEMVAKGREITDLFASEGSRELLELPSVVRSVTDRLGQRYPSASIELDLVPEAVVAARSELRGAIAELVENAIKHSDESKPSVQVSVTASDDAVDVTIADTGPGIPAVERNIVTGEQAIEPLYHGEGLGLWLVSWIVKRSGGTLEFEDNDPRGTVVRLHFPRAEGPV